MNLSKISERTELTDSIGKGQFDMEADYSAAKLDATFSISNSDGGVDNSAIDNQLFEADCGIKKNDSPTKSGRRGIPRSVLSFFLCCLLPFCRF